MDDNSTILVSKDGQQFSIPNDQENIDVAKSKGYQVAGETPPVDVSPLQEQLKNPYTALIAQEVEQSKISPQLSDADLTSDNMARVVSKDGQVYHIPSDEENIKIAKSKGYQLVSDIQLEYKQQKEDQQKLSEYTDLFKNKYGQGSALNTFLTQLPDSAQGALNTLASMEGNADPEAIKELEKQVEEFKKPEWQGIPDKYKSIILQTGIPAKDAKVAAQALDQLQSEHPVAQFTGGILHSFPSQEPALPLIGPLGELGVSAAGLATAKGVLPAVGRALINTGTVTALLNGPDALKTAIVDKDPEQAAENLLINGVFNLGLYAVGGAVGKGIEVAKGIKGGSLYDLMAPGIKSMVGRGEIDPVQADILRTLGADDKSINDYTIEKGIDSKKLDKTDLISGIDSNLGDLQGSNRAQIGRKILKLGTESGQEIGSLTNELDELSKSNSKVLLPEAHGITNIPEASIKNQFVDDYLQNRYAESVVNKSVPENLPYESWKTTSNVGNDVGNHTSDAEKLFEDIKANKVNEADFVNSRLEEKFNQEFAPDYTAKTHPEEFINWRDNEVDGKLTKQHAIEQYKNVRQYTPENMGLTKNVSTNTNDNYNARADGNKILDKISDYSDTAKGTLYENILKDDVKKVSSLLDENGKIDPKGMKELDAYFFNKIKEDVHSPVNRVHQDMSRIVKQERSLSESRIAAGAGKPELLEKLENAREKYRIYKVLNEGKDLINNNGGGVLTPGAQHGGVAGLARHGAGGLVGYALGGLMGDTPEERAKNRAIGGLLGVGTTLLAGKLLRNYWSEVGSYKLQRALYKSINSDKGVIDHLVINGAIKQKQLVKTIPSVLSAVANNEVDKEKLRKEKNNFDGLDVLLGEKGKGLSKAEKYAEVVKEVNNPNIQQNQLDIASSLNDAHLSPIITQKIAAMHAVLQKYLPSNTSNIPFTKNKPTTPTEQQLNTLNDVVRLVNNPEELLKDYQDGTLTPEKVNIIQSIYPGSLANMRQEIALQNQNIDLGLQDRLLLSMLMGSSLDPGLNNLAQLQSVGNVPTPSASTGSGKGRGHKSGGKNDKLPSFATGAQRNLMK